LSSLYWQSVQLSTIVMRGRVPPLRVLLAIGIAVASLAACDRQPSVAELLPAHPPPAVPAAPIADASDPGSPVATDPPPPAGDLKGDIDAFTTLDDCVRSHSHLDPLIGDAVEAIGYDTLIRDACTVVAAAKGGDARRCNAIDVSALRERCVSTVAELAEKPDTCPWHDPDRPLLGRDAACVAIASRDPRLCAAAAEEVDRATCVAVAGHDVAACAKLARSSDRLHCGRAAERWRTSISRAPSKSTSASEGTLHLETLYGGPGVDVDFARELAGGVVLEELRTAARLAFGRPRGESPDRLVPPMDRHDEVALELAVPPSDPNRSVVRLVRIERFDVVVRGVLYSLVAAPRSAGAGDSSLSAKVTSFERTRGGRIELSIEGLFGEGPHATKGRMRISTFVRDVVRPADVYGPSSNLSAQRSDADRAVALDAGSAQP
jgi:hypothetical protein